MYTGNGRKSLRLKRYNYSQAGAYFITICTHDRQCLFGNISDRQMSLNKMGKIVEKEWTKTALLRSNVQLDFFVIMPNHVHGIAIINKIRDCRKVSMGKAPYDSEHQFQSPSQTIGAIVRGFKSAVTRRINELKSRPDTKLWQRNYWERVIRNEAELYHIREYIQNNPVSWELDKLHPMNDLR